MLYAFIEMDVMVEMQTRSELSLNDQSGSATSSINPMEREKYRKSRYNVIFVMMNWECF